MRTPLTVATGLVLLAGVVVGVTTTAASADDAPAVQPIRVEAPPVPGAVADVETVVPVVPEVPAQIDPQPVDPQPAPRQEAAPRDPDGYVAPPPADDDDDGGDDDDDDDGDDDAGDDD